MKWSIGGVFLVVAVVTARMEEGGGGGWGQVKGVVSPLLNTIAKVEGGVEERQLAEASWYCYELTTLAENFIGMSQVYLFAGGANKEGKTIEIGKLSLLTTDEKQVKGQYCAATSAKNNGQHLTPNNDKIKYITKDSIKFYSLKVFMRDPMSVMEACKTLKATLTKMGLGKKVHFDRPSVIFNVGETGGEVLYPEN